MNKINITILSDDALQTKLFHKSLCTTMPCIKNLELVQRTAPQIVNQIRRSNLFKLQTCGPSSTGSQFEPDTVASAGIYIINKPPQSYLFDLTIPHVACHGFRSQGAGWQTVTNNQEEISRQQSISQQATYLQNHHSLRAINLRKS